MKEGFDLGEQKDKNARNQGVWGPVLRDLEASWDFCSRGVGVGGGVGRKL